MKLRDYQQNLVNDAYAAWASDPNSNVLMEMATGGGKTATFSKIMADERAPSVAIAHRQELVSQISLALARWDVPHRIIGPDKVAIECANQHRQESGVSYYSPSAPVAVAGVDTLIRRASTLGSWAEQVSLWAQDEAHHVLTGNKWGKAALIFPNARGLGVTATPRRADGKGLGRHADGLFDCMVHGPTMRALINSGNLTEYRIFCPPTDFDVSNVAVGASGDFVQAQLREANKKSHIVGDVVESYLRIARGKRGITFVVDVETAHNVAEEYRGQGVAAEAVSAKTPDAVRNELLRRFRNGDLDQLVNVDLFGEGFDVPAVEVVSKARPTQSFSLYAQQFGRALRPLEGKTHGLIIDHVQNVVRHGLPDATQAWTLDRRERSGGGSRSDALPISVCVNPGCMLAYERTGPTCPYCGHRPEPAGRSLPEQVDGDLFELSPEALAQLRGEVSRIDEPPEAVRNRMLAAGAPERAAYGAGAQHRQRQEVQGRLRGVIAWWAGYETAKGRDQSESYRRFYHKFGVDVMTAQTLGRTDARKLMEKIVNDIHRNF